MTQIQYAADEAQSLIMDIYYPSPHSPQAISTSAPVVVLVTGHVDSLIETTMGCKLKDTEQYRCWAKLLAASGIVAITYNNQNPAQDVFTLFNFLAENQQTLGVDVDNLGIWSCSANVPNALGLAMSKQFNIRCAAFLYGYMLDNQENSFVAQAASKAGFAAPNVNRTVKHLPPEMYLHIVRAGADQFPGINQTIDNFCADAIEENLPITLVNHPYAPHSFDIVDHSEQSKTIVLDVLRFFVSHLTKGEPTIAQVD